MNSEAARVAFFPDVYCEIDGVANTSRQFEGFARDRGLPFLIIHAGPTNEVVTTGSVTRVQLKRGWMKFPLDQAHEFDLLFLRHYARIAQLLKDFSPDVVQITGPNDVGILGTLLAHELGIPLAATWQTNLHQYAGNRVSKATSFLPKAVASRLPAVAEWLSFLALARFYRIPRFLFAPNQEVVSMLEKKTGKPCFLMSHAVNTLVFSPEFRDRPAGPFRMGYVGRLTPEKNVRMLARLEQSLLGMGHTDFRIVAIGEGAERDWLQNNMRHVECTGVLTGKALSRAFADLDVLVFPSETDTFGLVVLEALSSGVPVIVTAKGGPKYSVQHGKTGYVAANCDEFAAFAATLLTQPGLLSSMRAAARQYALSTSWEKVFESMYSAYERCLPAKGLLTSRVLDVATT